MQNPDYAGLLGRACPAAVYEYADAEEDDADAEGKKFVINSQVSTYNLMIGITVDGLLRIVYMCVEWAALRNL